jgi:hypothetical protein
MHAQLTAAIGDDPRVTAVLLTCSDVTARRRLSQREIGTALDSHVERSDLMARKLDESAPGWVHRVVTDGRTVAGIATEVIELSGWSADDAPPLPQRSARLRSAAVDLAGLRQDRHPSASGTA